MLEVKNLVKQYAGKGGVVVKALDDVSVKFPETGMVFLLGKSGSGKSTLLNVAGGLDKPDGGEIIVKGRSSKDFSAADFDSYRNTFVGFVFQEYNILNEFTIEQNIALALQLQNKPNDKKAVADLLEQVDLTGFAKRKPNTLSGGQKQRVAIARALIKNPEIIMADEPTGALDSNTGKQVLDTLKKLSEKKLVIVVSHDREFAEYYGDRIIELKDGKILSDVSKTYFTPDNADKNVQLIGTDTITVKNAEEITEKDVKEIVEMLKKNGGEAVITASKREIPDVKRACKINANGSKESFKDTDLEKVDIKDYDGKDTKFIKSHLPTGHAFKMGASGLKSKPIRLIFTVLLAVVAFVMFGVASTFMLYDPNYSITEAMKVAAYPDIVVGKYYDAVYQNVKIDNKTGEETITYSRDEQYATRFTAEELAAKNKEGLKFAGVFNFSAGRGDSNKSFQLTLKDGTNLTQVNVKNTAKYYYPVDKVMGFSDCGEQYMTENNFIVLAGAYPVNKTQIAIPEYVANLFVNTEGSGVTAPADMLGKQLRIMIGNGESKDFTVSAVYKVGDIPAKYEALKNVTTEIKKEQDQEKFNLANSLEDFIGHSFNTILFVSGDFYDEYKYVIQNYDGNNFDSEWVRALALRTSEIPEEQDVSNETTSAYTDTIVEKNRSSFKFYDFDGTEKTTFALSDGEIYVSERTYNDALRNRVQNYKNALEEYAKYDLTVKAALEDAAYTEIKDKIYEGSNAKTILNDYINVYYPQVAYRNYLFRAAERMINYGYADVDFVDAYNTINDYINDSSNPAFTDADWNVLKTAVESNFSATYPQQYYYVKLNELSDFNERRSVWGGVFGDDTYIIRDNLANNNYSDAEFNEIKTRIDAKYLEIMGFAIDAKSEEDVYEFDSNLISVMYYKDKSEATGTLNVLGYFTLSFGSGAEYVVKADFLDSHGIKENKGNGNDYTWKSRYQSDYVEPENAKYNLIVSKTNNSQAQINSVFSSDGAAVSYKIRNNVCDELGFFLDLITELQTVFLIVALVVGGFAALMLLNFISVSISSKRKDIGILRAVGARGSDVFKIFFAEAFIIAMICFVLAAVGSFIVCYELNKSLVNVVQMQLLNFNIVNIGIILGVSLVVSIIATFFPVYFAAKKSPVESIRAL